MDFAEDALTSFLIATCVNSRTEMLFVLNVRKNTMMELSLSMILTLKLLQDNNPVQLLDVKLQVQMMIFTAQLVEHPQTLQNYLQQKEFVLILALDLATLLEQQQPSVITVHLIL